MGKAAVRFWGFEVDGRLLWLQVLPTTKAQFEAFAADAGGFDNKWYEETQVLPAESAGTPWRTSPWQLSADNYEGLFMRTLQPSEVTRFAQWLAPGAEPPSAEIWRALHAHLQRQPLTDHHLAELVAPGQQADPLERLVQVTGAASLAQLTLMEGGLLEWVTVRTWRGTEWRLIGRPRQAFYPHAFDPVADPVEPVGTARMTAAGFRLVMWG